MFTLTYNLNRQTPNRSKVLHCDEQGLRKDRQPERVRWALFAFGITGNALKRCFPLFEIVHFVPTSKEFVFIVADYIRG